MPRGFRAHRFGILSAAPALRWAPLVLLICLGCAAEETFPNQIPQIKAAIGRFQEAVRTRDRNYLDSVTVDPELYDDIRFGLGTDSLVIRSLRIHNPIDSAHAFMTVERVSPEGDLVGRYELELFMRSEGDRYWIVGHRLTEARP